MQQLRTAGSWWVEKRGGVTQKTTVLGRSTFRGQAAQDNQIDVTSSANGVTYVLTSHMYSDVLNGMAITYGARAAVNTTAPNETYYTPALSYPLAMVLNTPYTMKYDQTTVQMDGSSAVQANNVQTVTYVGRETVNTAFGSFETCKLVSDFKNDTRQMRHTNWIVASGKYAGLSVQQSSDSGITQSESLEVSWN